LILITNVLVALVAALHAYFLILEMFLWDKPLGLKTFRNTPEKAEITKVLAANQGLYNGFLAAGLIWGLVQGILPALRDRGRRLRRGDRQHPHPARAGAAGGDRAGCAVSDLILVT
jgi:hypothetical protein